MQRQRRQPRHAFTLGLISGFVLTTGLIFISAISALSYVQQQGQKSATYAVTPDLSNSGNRVQLYFPLERFLAWRSTSELKLFMQGDTVHVRLAALIIPAFQFHVAVDIAGIPSVTHGYFTLQNVHGSVDAIPVPTNLLLGAIAMDGAKYGIHVNDAKDTLYVEKTFGSYQLAGYDQATRDLVISLPIQAVEQAARGQSVI